MKIKVLVVLSLVAIAAAVPAPAPAPAPTLGLVKGILGLGGKRGVRVGSLDLGLGIKNLFGNLIGHKHIARNHLNDVLDLQIENFNDVCNFLVKVTVFLSDTVEASITGLGELLARIILSLMKIIICLLGGAGSDNPICKADVNLLVGVEANSVADAQGIISLYGLGDAKARLGGIIALYTRGKGIKACRGSVRVVFKLALSLADRLQIIINRSGRLSKADLKFCIRHIVSLLGVIGNSRQKGLGLQIVQNFIPVCNKYIIKAGFPDIGDILGDVKIEIDAGNNDRAPWAVPDFDASVNTGVSLSLGGIIGNLFKGLIGVTRLATNLIQDILNLVIKSVDDVFTLALKIVLGLGGLLDSTIAGLGSLLVRIVAGLLKIILCFLGTGRYGVCQPTWDRQVGIRGNVNSIDLVFRLYGLNGCRRRVDRYIDTYTKGAGIQSTKGSIRILLQSCVTLADIVEAKKWDKNIVIIVFRHITYLLGAVGNSNSKGVGTSVCNKFIPSCNKYLTEAGFPGFGNDQDAIIKIVTNADDDQYTWTADIDDGDDNNNTGFIDDNGNDNGNDKNDNNDNNGNTGVTTGGNGGLVGGLFRLIFGTVKGVTQLVGNALNTLINIKINALNDIFTLITNLNLVLQVTLNNLVNGLGSLFVRLIACIIKIGVCVNGYPGDRGICTPEWNQRFGIKGDGRTAEELIVLFKVKNCEDELKTYILKRTKGKGINGARPSVRVILEKMTTLTVYIKNYKKITRQTITDTFIIMTTISASVGNSRKRDTGLEVIQKLIPQCGVYFKQQGYPDITVQIDIVKKDCNKANDDNVDWNGGDNGGDTPSGGDNDSTTPSPGGNNGQTTPSGGNNGKTTPSGGNNGKTTPSGGNNGKTTPSGGNNGKTTPAGGNNGKTTPSGGNNGKTTPSGGNNDKTTPSGGNNGKTTPSGGNNGKTTPSGGNNGKTTPSGGNNGKTTPSGGNNGKTTPSGGNNGKTTPSGGNNGKTTPSGGNNGKTTPSGGNNGNTTPSPGGDNENTTPSGGDNGNTTPSGGDNGNTTPSGGDNGNTTPSGGDSGKTTPSGGDNGNTTPSGGDNDKTTPSGGDNGNTTPSGGDNGNTTPSGGDNGNTTPSGGDNGNTTPSPGGDNDKTTPSGGDNGNTTPSGGDSGNTTPSGGDNGNTTPSGGDNGNTTPSGGDNGNTTPSGDNGNTTPSGGDNGNTTPSVGDNGNTTPSGGANGNTTPSGGDNDNTTPSSGGNDNDCGKDIGNVIQVIPGVTRLSSTIITELIRIKVNTFFDVVQLIVKLTLALGGIIDSIVSGLGSIISRIVAVIIKITYCLNNKGEESGNICTKEWNAQYGVVGEATSVNDLIALFRVQNCKKDVTDIINSYTKGKGVSSTTGVTKVILQTALDFSSIVTTTTTVTITKESFSNVFVSMINVFGSITNSYKKGSGTVVIKKVLPVCGAWFVKRGYPDVRKQQKTILTTVSIGDSDNFDWTVIKPGGSTNSDQLVTNVKQVFKDVKQKDNVNQPSVNAVLNLQPPSNFDDVCNFGVQVVLALGSIIDVFIKGLGTLIVRVVGCLIHYIVAILGASRNAKSFVSQKAYYSTFGITVSTKLTTWADLSTAFKIKDCKSDLTNILNSYTKNKGRQSLKGSEKVVFDCAFSLVDIVNKGQSIKESDLTDVFYSVTNMLGGFANSLSAGVGDKICDNMLPTVSYYLEQNSYPSLAAKSKTIYTTIGQCSGVSAPWVSGTTTVVQEN